MAGKQIVKTNKRMVFALSNSSGTPVTQIIGLTASAFYNLANAEELQQSLVSGITAGSACLSKVISGGSCTVEQRGEILWTGGAGEYNFERFTLRSITGGVTAAVSASSGTAVVEFVVGHAQTTPQIAF